MKTNPWTHVADALPDWMRGIESPTSPKASGETNATQFREEEPGVCRHWGDKGCGCRPGTCALGIWAWCDRRHGSSGVSGVDRKEVLIESGNATKCRVVFAVLYAKDGVVGDACISCDFAQIADPGLKLCDHQIEHVDLFHTQTLRQICLIVKAQMPRVLENN